MHSNQSSVDLSVREQHGIEGGPDRCVSGALCMSAVNCELCTVVCVHCTMDCAVSVSREQVHLDVREQHPVRPRGADHPLQPQGVVLGVHDGA